MIKFENEAEGLKNTLSEVGMVCLYYTRSMFDPKKSTPPPKIISFGTVDIGGKEIELIKNNYGIEEIDTRLIDFEQKYSDEQIMKKNLIIEIEKELYFKDYRKEIPYKDNPAIDLYELNKYVIDYLFKFKDQTNL